MQKTRFSKVNNNFLELEKDSIALKDSELKDIKVKSKREREREREKLFFKLIIVSIVSINDIDKPKKVWTKKRREGKAY